MIPVLAAVERSTSIVAGNESHMGGPDEFAPANDTTRQETGEKVINCGSGYEFFGRV